MEVSSDACSPSGRVRLARLSQGVALLHCSRKSECEGTPRTSPHLLPIRSEDALTGSNCEVLVESPCSVRNFGKSAQAHNHMRTSLTDEIAHTQPPHYPDGVHNGVELVAFIGV